MHFNLIWQYGLEKNGKKQEQYKKYILGAEQILLPEITDFPYFEFNYIKGNLLPKIIQNLQYDLALITLNFSKPI